MDTWHCVHCVEPEGANVPAVQTAQDVLPAMLLIPPLQERQEDMP